MMITPSQVISIEYHDDKVFLRLADGREIGNPLKWHPWLEKATQAQRDNVEDMMKGIPPRAARQPMNATP